MLTKNISQLNPKGEVASPGDFLAIWDIATGTTKRIAISELPVSFGSGGTGSVTVLGSPFKVFNGDPSYVIDSGNSIITDVRLMGKTGYIVSSTQVGSEFRNSQLTYDPTNGKVTISAFVLGTGEHISIYADGTTVTTNYNSLLTDLAMLKLIAAPFYITPTGANGGMLLWKRPAAEIPAGWQEVVNWRGRMPMGWDPDDPDFATVRTSNGGAKTVTLTKANMPTQVRIDGEASEYSETAGATGHTIKNSFPGGGTSISIVNPYRIVMFIEFIGI